MPRALLDAERPRPVTVVVSAVLGMAIGLGVVRWSLAGEGAVRADGALLPAPQVAPAAAGRRVPLPVDPALPPAAPGTPGAAAPVTPPPPPPAPAPPPAAAPEDARPLVVEHGRIAYLHCEGAERQDGAYPCPRDEALERRVWAVVDALPSCVDPVRGRGEVDLRLAFDGPAQAGARVVVVAGEVERWALDRCLAEATAGLETNVPASRTVVSFRFTVDRPPIGDRGPGHAE